MKTLSCAYPFPDSFSCFVSFSWTCDPSRSNVILLNIMDLNLLSLGTLVPASGCVFYATRNQTETQMTWLLLVLWSSAGFPIRVQLMGDILGKMAKYYMKLTKSTFLRQNSGWNSPSRTSQGETLLWFDITHTETNTSRTHRDQQTDTHI